MINFLTENSGNMGDTFSFINGTFSFFPILLIGFGVIFALILGLIIFVFVKGSKVQNKPYVYRYNGHELQVLISMGRIQILYDGKVVDEIVLSYNAAGATFNEFLDGVHYKINIGANGFSPSVIVFANNEKLASE